MSKPDFWLCSECMEMYTHPLVVMSVATGVDPTMDGFMWVTENRLFCDKCVAHIKRGGSARLAVQDGGRDAD